MLLSRHLHDFRFGKWCLALLIVLGVCFFASRSECESGKGYMKFYNAAIKLMYERKYEKAIRVLNLGIKKYQTAHVLYYQKGVIEQDYFGKWNNAIKNYTVKLKLNKEGRADHA